MLTEPPPKHFDREEAHRHLEVINRLDAELQSQSDQLAKIEASLDKLQKERQQDKNVDEEREKEHDATMKELDDCITRFHETRRQFEEQIEKHAELLGTTREEMSLGIIEELSSSEEE